MYRGQSNAKLPIVDQPAASDGCHIASEAVKASNSGRLVGPPLAKPIVPLSAVAT